MKLKCKYCGCEVFPKYKSDDIVYCQEYGIGHYIKGKILIVEVSRDGSKFIYKTQHPNEPEGTGVYREAFELFSNLDDLKKHWIDCINEIE